jgi:hypothetical protein
MIIYPKKSGKTVSVSDGFFILPSALARYRNSPAFSIVAILHRTTGKGRIAERKPLFYPV